VTSAQIGDEECAALVNAGDATVRRLVGELLRLRAAIVTHAAKRGRELHWLIEVGRLPERSNGQHEARGPPAATHT
jgi:hypothetical protein